MDSILKKVKNVFINHTWFVYMCLICLFVISPNPLSWKNLILIIPTFFLNLYKDKVRDRLNREFNG